MVVQTCVTFWILRPCNNFKCAFNFDGRKKTTMGQITYIWHDDQFDAFKIGKTDNEKRFANRIREAIGSNLRLRFVGTWRTSVEKGLDAGSIVSGSLPQVKFASGAREWFSAPSDDAVIKLGDALFGIRKFTSLPQPLLNGKPWDPFGNLNKKGTGASRFWLHREKRKNGKLKISDNSWWSPNLKTTWNNTFNPDGFELLGSYEWPELSNRRNEWSALNLKARETKEELHTDYGITGLPRVQQTGWFDRSLDETSQLLIGRGLEAFDSKDGPRPGVNGQGETY